MPDWRDDIQAATHLEDVAHASGDRGTLLLAVRQDAAAALAAAGDYIPLIVDASGRLHVAPLPAGAASLGATKDDGPNWTSVFGVGGARFTSADQSAAEAAVSDAPTAGQKLVVTDVVISADTAMRVDLSEEDSAGVLVSFFLAAGSTVQFTPRAKWKLATADKQLMVQTSAAGNVSVSAWYYSEA